MLEIWAEYWDIEVNRLRPLFRPWCKRRGMLQIWADSWFIISVDFFAVFGMVVFVLFVDCLDTQWCDSLDSIIYCPLQKKKREGMLMKKHKKTPLSIIYINNDGMRRSILFYSVRRLSGLSKQQQKRTIGILMVKWFPYDIHKQLLQEKNLHIYKKTLT